MGKHVDGVMNSMAFSEQSLPSAYSIVIKQTVLSTSNHNSPRNEHIDVDIPKVVSSALFKLISSAKWPAVLVGSCSQIFYAQGGIL